MREELDTLLSEIKRLKQNGVSSVLLEKTSLDLLESAAKKRIATQPTVAPIEAPIEARKQPLPTKASAAPEKPTKLPPKKEVFDYHTLPEFTLPEGTKEEKFHWLKDKVLSCPVCNNHIKPGKKIVFGVGSLDADIFFCGEAPETDEEKLGEPFVGPAGQLLTKIIQAAGLKREDVYIGNIMNWRPETDSPYGNRPPNQDEMAFCLPYLKAQLEIVKPKIVVALGATTVHGLLGYDPTRSITKCRGTWESFEGIPTIISFHPSYVLRNGTNKIKRQIWEDILSVMEKLEMPISERQQGFFK